MSSTGQVKSKLTHNQWDDALQTMESRVVTHQFNRRRYAFALLTALLSLFAATQFDARVQITAETLPKQLSDGAFWRMIVDFSEPEGLFRSDNFVSNERTYQEVIPELKKRSSPDGVYLGVGPDQNFTYITALGPRMAFIIDIRRQNLIQHLLYKAVIELSVDRSDFLSRLFSRPRPAGLEESSTPEILFDAYRDVAGDEMLFQKNLQDVEDQLVEEHGFPLTAEDLRNLEYVYRAFFAEGPDLRYSFPRQRSTRLFPTYAELITATDRAGLNHSYLADEPSFRTLREFERNNLLIPIVGDFGGNKAIRAVSRYLTEHQATVNYFYTSNVEQYLFQSDAWRRYYSSVAALPVNENSTLIRAYFDAGFLFPPGIITPDLHSVQLLDPILSLLNAFGAGQIGTYHDVVERSK
jgi:hypothetical protein